MDSGYINVLAVSQPGISSRTWKRRGIKPSAEFVTLDAHEKLYCQKRGLHPCVPFASHAPSPFLMEQGIS